MRCDGTRGILDYGPAYGALLIPGKSISAPDLISLIGATCMRVEVARHQLMARALSLLLIVVAGSEAEAAGKIHYGSRAGMQVTVISMSGLDTANAVIRTRHAKEDAIAFCREYVGKVTERCIRDELATPLNDQITANCLAGIFTDFRGTRHHFKGKNPNKGAMAKYILVDLDTNKIADGSMASGYGVSMAIFRALCPRAAPRDE